MRKEDQTHDITDCPSGQLAYFGIRKQLEKKANALHDKTETLLTINIDGLPLFKNLRSEFWPILGSI